MQEKSITVTLIVCLTLVGFQCIGAFIPSVYNWGFHFLGFLPMHLTFIMILIAITAFVVIVYGKQEIVLNTISSFNEKFSLVFVLATCGVFLVLALLFRIQAPLWGDSYLIINNIEHTLAGKTKLITSSEPLSMFFYYIFCIILGITQTQEILSAFFIGDIFLGIGYILNVYYISRMLFPQGKQQLWLFGFLMATPSLQLFFAYVEVYPITLFCLSFFMLLLVLYLRQRLPFYLLLPAFAILLMVHYLNGLLLPSIAFLTYIEIKRKGYQHVYIGVAGAILTAFIVIWIFDFNFLSIIHREHKMFLSPFSLADEFQAYPLFSFAHVIDLFNLFVLIGPFATLLATTALSQQRREIFSLPEGKLFLLYVIPFTVFFCIVKLDLSMAKDWDIPATFMFPVNLFSGYLFFQTIKDNYSKQIKLIIITSMVLLAPFFYLNSTIESNIARLKTIMNPSFMSGEARYMTLNHLSKYYFLHKNQHQIIELWKQYVASYPQDWRAYRALTNTKMQLGNVKDNEIIALFEAWIRTDPTKESMRDDYLQYCNTMSRNYLREGKVDSAFLFSLKAINFDTTSAVLYNNLGVLYRAIGNNIRATEIYKKAIELDPTYILSYINIANTYDDLGNPDTALLWYHKAIQRDTSNTGIYENMAITYYKMKDSINYIASLSRAARFGSREAQQFLWSIGIAW